jgi:tRNA (cmo5U34)-methyltransferase
MNEFDVRATEWDTPQRVTLAQRMVDEISEKVDLNASMDVMEYGCGTGLVGLQLLEKVKSVTFLDTSSGMLNILASKIGQKELQHAHVYNVDLSVDVEFTGEYDLIVTSMTLHHIVDSRAIVRRFAGLLKPGGQLAIIDLVSEDGSFHGDNFDGHNGFDVERLCAMFREEDLRVVSTGKFVEVKRDNGRSYPLFIIVGQK